MIFIGTAKVSTDPLGQLSGGQQAIGLDHVAFAMNPFGLNGVQPGTLGGEKEGQNAHPLAFLLDLLVVFANEGSHFLTVVPGGVVPDQQPGGLSLLRQLLAAPIEKLGGDVADWASSHKAQRHLTANGMSSFPLLPEHAITGQRLGVGVGFLPGLLHQVDRVISILPGMKLRQSKTAPPDFIEKPDSPVWTRAGVVDQTVTCRFFGDTSDRDW